MAFSMSAIGVESCRKCNSLRSQYWARFSQSAFGAFTRSRITVSIAFRKCEASIILDRQYSTRNQTEIVASTHGTLTTLSFQGPEVCSGEAPIRTKALQPSTQTRMPAQLRLQFHAVGPADAGRYRSRLREPLQSRKSREKRLWNLLFRERRE